MIATEQDELLLNFKDGINKRRKAAVKRLEEGFVKTQEAKILEDEKAFSEENGLDINRPKRLTMRGSDRSKLNKFGGRSVAEDKLNAMLNGIGRGRVDTLKTNLTINKPITQKTAITSKATEPTVVKRVMPDKKPIPQGPTTPRKCPKSIDDIIVELKSNEADHEERKLTLQLVAYRDNMDPKSVTTAEAVQIRQQMMLLTIYKRILGLDTQSKFNKHMRILNLFFIHYGGTDGAFNMININRFLDKVKFNKKDLNAFTQLNTIFDNFKNPNTRTATSKRVDINRVLRGSGIREEGIGMLKSFYFD